MDTKKLLLGFIEWLENEKEIELCDCIIPRQPIDCSHYETLIDEFIKKDN